MIDDDGKGITEELREQAFAAGQRLEDAEPGSGLGLAIARDLARYYGGEVTLGDSPQGGLRATVMLNLASEGLAQDDAPAPRPVPKVDSQ